MLVSIVILAIVFLLIAVRKIGSIRLEIWQIMVFGAVAALLTGQISLVSALKAVNIDVMLFLFGMFVIGQALEESGYLSHLSHKLFGKAKSPDQIMLFILFGFGLLSAFLMNDTVAIIGTPVVLALARKNKLPPKPLLFALAFAITIGGTVSPIGNPQNLLIAMNGGIKNPFMTFFRFLLIPTIVNLFVAYFLLKVFFKRKLVNSGIGSSKDKISEEQIKDSRLAALAKVSLILVFILSAVKIMAVFTGVAAGVSDFSLAYIALLSALPVLLLSPRRFGILKKVDWSTIAFFASMFILMESVWLSGFFQSEISKLSLDISSMPVIFAVSVLISQFISNVPLVALYLPVLVHAGASAKEMVALAAGSTIAGNLLILGAASNVIIIQAAEKKAGETLTFLEFAKIGIPLTIINVAVYWLFIVVI